MRQAISCAIDRQELIDTALLGEGVPTGPFVEGIYATEPYDGLPCVGPDQRHGARAAHRGRLPGRVLDGDDHHHRRERDQHQHRPEPAGAARRDRCRPRARPAGDQRLRRPLARRRLRLGAVGERFAGRPAPHVLALLHLRRQLRERRRAHLAGAGRAVRRGAGRDRPRSASADLRRDLADPARGVAVGVALPGLPLPGPVPGRRGLRRPTRPARWPRCGK